MSLVEYDASSSDEDDDVPTEAPEAKPQRTSVGPLPQTRPQNLSETHKQPENSNPLPAPSFAKLPDASELLNSADFPSTALSGMDHSSLVAAAMAQSASRKRDSLASSSSLPRSNKLPKVALNRSKNVPDTSAQMLVPPQLGGRSNVVTEDINKLFVKKKVEPAEK